ncbi:GIY-YIG nuclease family protein [Sphingomonas aerolata]|nr:GIY-YIG nuclease family protein [Sphingomonas aerolata]
MIYFIGSDIGAIKIGRAIRPKVRLRQLQSGSPIPLMILATTPGGVDEEKAYHDRFRKQRIRGEWFERSAELLAEIRRLNET